MAAGTAAAGSQGSRTFLWVSVLGLLLVVALPALFIVLVAIFPRIGSGSLAAPFVHLIDTLADPDLARLGGNTLLMGAGTVSVAALLAVPLAALRALFRVPGALLWDVLMLVPFMIPPYIAALSWIMTLQPRGYMEQLTGVNLGWLLFSVPGIMILMALNTFPVVYFILSRTFETVGARYSDVGRVFGAGPWRAFARITLPLATPGIAASLLLVFAMTIEEYGTPAALGRRIGFEVLVTGIENRVSEWPIDLPGAATLSLVLVTMALAAFVLQRWLLSRRDFRIIGGKPQMIVKRPLGGWTVPVVLLFALVSSLATLIPVLAILASALCRTISGGLRPANMGLDNFAALLDAGGSGLTALGHSLALGGGTAVVAGLLGAITAYAVVKGRGRMRGFLDGLSLTPNAMPGVVVAVGIILAWNQPWLPLSPYNTPLILLLAYTCILLPQPVRYANAALSQLGDNLEAAAQVSGAGANRAFLRIVLPLIAPSILTSMILVFAVASRELVASLLVAPIGFETIAVYIWRQFDQGSVGMGMTMAFCAIVITTLIPLALIAVLRRLSRQGAPGLHPA
ncbi:ABC transporter permease [Phaeovulum vinaykumarii]|uniref:Iron(III) transport system permease protein n=1 Tax=Phaeovulum vinaykumarii TaxID=407234 RepID=A0A1N7LK61_9RHOB|nr:iron ABC transporter permease [Phaeovulum vinaykumarii]SIS74197.1 iron(III) transport system permease protein [Phaeovulum vinaykumarii]SOC04922.1 iron(III) transport system permease protein [Phaeovulum vinaykumarii]